MVQFETVHSIKVTGKLQRLAVNIENKEVIITFMLGGKETTRYECDIKYFNENLEILYGDSYRGERTNIRRLLENDR